MLSFLCKTTFRFIPFLTIAFCNSFPTITHARDLNSVTIRQFDGSTITATIDSIDGDGNLSGSDLPADLNLQDVVAIESNKKSARPVAGAVTLQLTSGGQFFIGSPRIKTEKLLFQSISGPSEISLQAVRGIVWTNSSTIETRLASPSSDQDIVYVQTDDGERRIAGIIEQLDGEHLQINYENQSRKIGVSKIKAIVMADLGLPPSTGSLATLDLTDGSTVVGVIEELTDGILKIGLTGNISISVDTEFVGRISIQSDRLQFLSDLQPVDVQQRTEFTIQRSWQKDQSVENNPLAIRVGKSNELMKFSKGLGTQAFTQLVFDNTDNFNRFMSTVGIDAETRGRGDCQFVVRGDGIELWSERIRGTDKPRKIDINISGMKQIALIVYPGNDFDLADHADWGNARFVKNN